MPVTVTFAQSIANRAAAERTISVHLARHARGIVHVAQ